MQTTLCFSRRCTENNKQKLKTERRNKFPRRLFSTGRARSNNKNNKNNNKNTNNNEDKNELKQGAIINYIAAPSSKRTCAAGESANFSEKSCRSASNSSYSSSKPSFNASGAKAIASASNENRVWQNPGEWGGEVVEGRERESMTGGSRHSSCRACSSFRLF